ncbi:MAG: hypothetical protein ACJAYU_002532 [Bradymonadia bacterium]|jgi:hypothetical protein
MRTRRSAHRLRFPSSWTSTEDFVDGEFYYWRVKAKDISNFRWTDWSPIWSVQIDSSVPEDLI